MNKKKAQEREIVRIECPLDGFDECWVDYDISDWGIYEWRAINSGRLTRSLEDWVEVHSCDWHIVSKDGTPVPHPGYGAGEESYLEAYKKMGGGMAMAEWLSGTPFSALMQAFQASKKSDAGDEAGGG